MLKFRTRYRVRFLCGEAAEGAVNQLHQLMIVHFHNHYLINASDLATSSFSDLAGPLRANGTYLKDKYAKMNASINIKLNAIEL